MRTVDRAFIAAGADRVQAVAAQVEAWPEFLPHYRWVRFHERHEGGGRVEMSAWRHFGPMGWPTWWMSDMWTTPGEYGVRYRHIRGITSGMDVEWRIAPHRNGTSVEIVHEWTGPRWPLIGRFAARAVIGPVFIHHIASRTLAGVKRRAESA